MHIDHGSRPKAIGLGWKYPSNDFQDPRKSWREARGSRGDWSSIHGEVKEAKSIKTTMVVWVPGWNKKKRGKNLDALSLPSDYIYIYIYTL